MSSELIRQMIFAHTIHDDAAFQVAVKELIFEEKKKKHPVFANELERILNNCMAPSSAKAKTFTLFNGQNSDLPRDSERGAVLVEIREARKRFDELVLSENIKSALDRIVLEYRRMDLLGTYGLRPSQKILFCGPPGCGKTVSAECIAEALYLPFVVVRFDAVVSSYLGETSNNLRKVFDFAQSRPMVVLFDEFDAIGKSRTTTEEHGELKRVVNSYLQMLDGYKGSSILIAATNHQGLLDSALWRRFDEIIYFEKPTAEFAEMLLEEHLRQIGLSPKIRLSQVARLLTDMSHADIERIALDAIKQTILTGNPKIESCILQTAVNRQRERLELTTNISQQGDKMLSKKIRKTKRRIETEENPNEGESESLALPTTRK